MTNDGTWHPASGAVQSSRMARSTSPRNGLALALLLGACQPDPVEVPGAPTSSDSSSGPAPSSSSTIDPASTGIGSGSATGTSTSTGSSTSAETSGSSSGTTVAVDGSGSSEESSTGEPSPIGCADGTRDALVDEVLHPNIAACAGGFGVPGVHLGTPLCDRQGGNDGLLPDGMGCSIEDLCAAGWHLCTSQGEVMAAGIANCNDESWGSQFFATAQSGQGKNACNPMGTDDVFGCGDIGYSHIDNCAPLNRSTGNLCVELIGPWDCPDDSADEVSHLTKAGPDNGGALCCRN